MWMCGYDYVHLIPEWTPRWPFLHRYRFYRVQSAEILLQLILIITVLLPGICRAKVLRLLALGKLSICCNCCLELNPENPEKPANPLSFDVAIDSWTARAPSCHSTADNKTEYQTKWHLVVLMLVHISLLMTRLGEKTHLRWFWFPRCNRSIQLRLWKSFVCE